MRRRLVDEFLEPALRPTKPIRIAALPEAGNTQITDLHVWRVGNGAYACAISLLTHDAALTPLQIREALGIHEEIVHVTGEIHRCDIC